MSKEKPSLFAQLFTILLREIPDVEVEWAEDAAEEIHALIIELYGPPF